MEVIYEGPKSLFDGFTRQLFDEFGVSEYTITEGILKKGWVADEFQRFVVQFDLDETRSQSAAFQCLCQWAKAQAASVVLKMKNHDGDGPDDDTAQPQT